MSSDATRSERLELALAVLATLGLAGCAQRTAVSAPDPAVTQAAEPPALPMGPGVAPSPHEVNEDVPGDCGTAVLRRVELGALGYGKNHPAMIGLEAKVASCPREVEVPADLCGEALLQRQALELTGAGTNHPAVLAANAMLSVCRKPIRVTRKQCGSIAKWRSHLVSNGLGERHPDVVAAEARLAACTAARKLSPPVPGRAHLILRGGSGDYTAVDEPLKALMRALDACAPVDADRHFTKDVLELTIVMDRKRVTDAPVAGETASAETIACVSQAARASDLRGSPKSKLILGVELSHGYYK